ncbi:MAG: ABC transporter ATP-binding protein [bacterium]
MIRTEGLTKTFDGDKKTGKITAVDRLDLDVKQGEVFGFLGPNGAGKTTTVRMLCTLIGATAGQAWVNDLEVGKDDMAIRASVGILTEQPGMYDRLSAEKNLDIYARLYGVPDPAGQVEKYLRMLDLWERRRDPAGSFSKGMKQKLAIARALIHDPEILFLDEPTAGLDPEASEDVILYLQKYIKDGKRTVFLCSHRLDEVERLSQAIAIIYQGHILANGTIEELRSQLWKEKFYSIRLIEARDDFVAALKHEKYISQVVRREQEIGLAVVTGTDIARAIRLLVNIGAEILSVQEEEHSLKDIYFAIVPKGNHE